MLFSEAPTDRQLLQVAGVPTEPGPCCPEFPAANKMRKSSLRDMNSSTSAAFPHHAPLLAATPPAAAVAVLMHAKVGVVIDEPQAHLAHRTLVTVKVERVVTVEPLAAGVQARRGVQPRVSPWAGLGHGGAWHTPAVDLVTA